MESHGASIGVLMLEGVVRPLESNTEAARKPHNISSHRYRIRGQSEYGS